MSKKEFKRKVVQALSNIVCMLSLSSVFAFYFVYALVK